MSKYHNDSTVHEIKDANGRVIERWGNYNTDDYNSNFRHFFQYDTNGFLINERQYWLDDDNKNCVITDTAEYRDIYYYYKYADEKYVLEVTKCYDCFYDSNSKFIGRKLYYIYDEIKKKYLFGGPDN